MTPEERERINQLCAMLPDEKDLEKLAFLVRELKTLLEKTEREFYQLPPIAPK